MNRDLFKKMMNDSLENKEPLKQNEQLAIIRQSIRYLDNQKGKQHIEGFHNLIIVMEELAELTQEVSKALRDKLDINGMVEELADASICIDYIKEILDITDNEIEHARSIKLLKLKNSLDSNTL